MKNNEINDGGPAFPKDESEDQYGCDGMSRRDYFAAKAMQATLSNADGMSARVKKIYGEDISDFVKKIAELSYCYADAMIEQSKN